MCNSQKQHVLILLWSISDRSGLHLCLRFDLCQYSWPLELGVPCLPRIIRAYSTFFHHAVFFFLEAASGQENKSLGVCLFRPFWDLKLPGLQELLPGIWKSWTSGHRVRTCWMQVLHRWICSLPLGGSPLENPKLEWKSLWLWRIGHCRS